MSNHGATSGVYTLRPSSDKYAPDNSSQVRRDASPQRATSSSSEIMWFHRVEPSRRVISSTLFCDPASTATTRSMSGFVLTKSTAPVAVSQVIEQSRYRSFRPGSIDAVRSTSPNAAVLMMSWEFIVNAAVRHNMTLTVRRDVPNRPIISWAKVFASRPTVRHQHLRRPNMKMPRKMC